MTGTHVLLVEDSEFMAQQVSDTLKTFHEYKTSTVETAAAARGAVETGNIDCVLVNHDLPDESGMEFAESVTADIPIILLTTTTLEDVAKEAIDAGVTEFVHKDNLAQSTMNVLANRIDVAIRAVEE